MSVEADMDQALPLLLRICESEPPEVMRQWIGSSGAKAEFECLTSIGALRHVDNASLIRCYACDETHETTVEMVSPGRFRAYCPDAGFQDCPSSDDLRSFIGFTNGGSGPSGLTVRPPARDVASGGGTGSVV